MKKLLLSLLCMTALLYSPAVEAQQLTFNSTLNSPRVTVLAASAGCTDTTGLGTVTCTYGGLMTEAIALIGGSVTGRLCACFPGNTGPTGATGASGEIGHYTTEAGDPVAGLLPGGPGYALKWSSSDGAFWRVSAWTGLAASASIGLWDVHYANSSCTGARYVGFNAANEVFLLGGSPFRQGAVTSPGTCYHDEGGSCFMGTCPAVTVAVVAATDVPDFSADAPVKLER